MDGRDDGILMMASLKMYVKYAMKREQFKQSDE